MLLAAACSLVSLAGCGGTATPQSALTKQFTAITKVYPFHADLSGQSRLYFLIPKPASASSPPLSTVAAVLYRYKSNWSVWQYASIADATGPYACDDALGATVSLTTSPLDLQPPKPVSPNVEQTFSPKYILIAGQLEQNAQAVGRLVLTLGGRSYAARVLPDGFWFVRVRNTGGRLDIALKDPGGREICDSRTQP